MTLDIQGKEKMSYDELMEKLVEKLTDMFNNKEINVIELVGIYVIVEKMLNNGWISDSECLENIVNELVGMARGNTPSLVKLGLICLLETLSD